MPDNKMRISHSLIKSKANEIDEIIEKYRKTKGITKPKRANDRIFFCVEHI